MEAERDEAKAERDRYRAIVGHVVRRTAMDYMLPSSKLRAIEATFGIDEQAARELCAEFGVSADGGETI